MTDDPPVAEMLEIASSVVPLLERARGIVDSLDRWLPVDAVWMTLADHGSHVYATVGSAGLERTVVHYLEQPSGAPRERHRELDRERETTGGAEPPARVGAVPSWADCLIPAGFPTDLGVRLAEPGGSYVGMLSLLFTGAASMPAALRDQVAQLAPVIVGGVSPLRSLIATARLVRGATEGAVLLRDGSCFPLPGLADLVVLTDDSAVLDIARQTLVGGQVYRSFLWPTPDGPGSEGHAAVTVFAATDVPASVLGTVLVTPDGQCHGLTARELEVLGLLVNGRSNQQISSRLSIAPGTVATHVEHILQKLEVYTRTQAAVRAERDGCYVPSVRRTRGHRDRPLT